MRPFKLTVKSNFFTKEELIIYTVVFLLALAIVFPKGRLEKYILTSEKTNVELYYIYTRNLATITGDRRIWVEAVKNMSAIGNIDVAEKLAEESRKSGYEDVSYLSLYFAEKARYFGKKGGSLQKMEEYLLKAVEKTNSPEVLMEAVKEGKSMSLGYPVMLASEKLYRLSKDVKWLKEAYNYAIAEKRAEYVVLYASELYRLEGKRSYVSDALYALRAYGGGQELLERLKDYLPVSFYEKLKSSMEGRAVALSPAEPQSVQTQSYAEVKSSFQAQDLNAYLREFNSARSTSRRKKLFVKIVQAYAGSGRYEEMKSFIAQHYEEFIYDDRMSVFILRMALASGDPAFAHKIAQKIKEERLK